MHFTKFTLFLLLGAMLAGCAGSEGGYSTSEGCQLEPVLCDREAYLSKHHCVANDVTPRVYAPDMPSPERDANPWKLGDSWTYSLDVDGEKLDETTLVYYDDQDFDGAGIAQHYMVGTPTREEALHHALFSSNPLIGRIHRTLYSPHESGEHADMFHFPLCEDSRWSTRFFATDFRMEVSQQTISIPGGSDAQGFVIRGTAPGASIVIEYSPEAQWFSKLDFQKGDQAVKMVMTERESGQSGKYHFLRGQKDVDADLSLIEGAIPIEREAGKDGPYDKLGIYLEFARASGDGGVEVRVEAPDGTVAACIGVTGSSLLGAQTECKAGPVMIETDWQEGDWQIVVDKGALSDTQITGQAKLVSIYDRGGTV